MDRELRKILDSMKEASRKKKWAEQLDLNPAPVDDRELTWQTAMHDAASALGMIRREAEGLLASGDLDEANRGRAGRIHAEAVKVRGLLEAHLGPRRGNGELGRIDANDVMQGAADMLRRTSRRRMTIETDLDADAWPLVGDPALLGRAVTNLVLNAEEAIADMGTIRLITGNVELDDERAGRIGLHAPGRYVRLAVADDGHGITDDVARNMFRAHYSTRRDRSGRGLGLSVVRNAVDHAGGSVRFRKGRLTTFEMYVPAAVNGEAGDPLDPPECLQEATRPGPDGGGV